MSSSSPPPAEGVRVHWEDLPPAVRHAIEERIPGHVVEAITQPGGFSPGFAARLLTADGHRCFVKAVSVHANPDTPDLHRREAAVVAALPLEAPVPRLLWSYDEGDWVALGGRAHVSRGGVADQRDRSKGVVSSPPEAAGWAQALR